MNTTAQPGPLEVRLSDLLGPALSPAAWQERQKLSDESWTHWYECQPFPRSAPRDFMIDLIPAQRRILQTEVQMQAAINSAVAAERERAAEDVDLLRHALLALTYHRDQTRPIADSDAVIARLRTRLLA